MASSTPDPIPGARVDSHIETEIEETRNAPDPIPNIGARVDGRIEAEIEDASVDGRIEAEIEEIEEAKTFADRWWCKIWRRVDADTETEIEKAVAEIGDASIFDMYAEIEKAERKHIKAEIEKHFEAKRKRIFQSKYRILKSIVSHPLTDVEAQYGFSADEIEKEHFSRVNQMDFEATVSPRSQYLRVVPSVSGAVSVRSVSGALNFIRRLDLGLLAQMFRLALNVLGAIGTKEITKLSLGLFIQLTTCLVAYYIYLNSGSSPQLSKPLFYSVAVTDTVGFLSSGIGIAIRNSQPRVATIFGGIGALLAAATFYLIISSFIS